MRVNPQYECDRSQSWSFGERDSLREILISPREDPNPMHPVLMTNGLEWIPWFGGPAPEWRELA